MKPRTRKESGAFLIRHPNRCLAAIARNDLSVKLRSQSWWCISTVMHVGGRQLHSLRTLLLAGAASLALSAPSLAGQYLLTPDPLDEAFFGFGGAMMNDVFNPFGGFEPNILVGGAYQRFWGNPGRFQYGLEAGLAGRFGVRNSLEAWGGAVARYDWTLGPVQVGLGFTLGLSGVTDTVEGQESQSEAFHNGNAALLFYMGPEIHASLVEHPRVEYFFRIHHRSGAWETLGHMAAGADAAVTGLRLKF
jgi:hypothetical protein